MPSCREAVLLIAFNRPDLLQDVINRVRQAEPPRVYLAVDGPRRDRAGESARVQACRELAAQLDWGCDVRTLYRDENLGCGRGVSSAVSWFFDHEEQGIILEDDIVPSPEFFSFVSDLLDVHADDPRVFAVTGTNFVPPEHISTTGAYRFSRVPIVWGWGAWRRSWMQYRFELAGWRSRMPGGRQPNPMGESWLARRLWSVNFDLMRRHAIDTWDLQLVCAAMTAGAWTATPNVNLVENAGFRSDATHTVRRPDYLRSPQPIGIPVEPQPVQLDEVADRWTMEHVYGATISGFAGQAFRGITRSLSGLRARE